MPRAVLRVGSAALVAAIAIASGALGGCVSSRTAPIDLYRADTKVIRFALKNPRSTVCPGQPVPLDVELDALVDGELLHLKQRRFDLDDYMFHTRQLHLSSAQGFFSEDGVFYPNPDVTVSAQTGFVIFIRAPHGPSFSVRFPPAYECTAQIGRAGRYGAPGIDGYDATVADKDPHTHRDAAATGGIGQDGGEGGAGPRLEVFVTWVRTPDYTKLLAARSFGDVQTITLAPPGTPLTVLARGGQGGMGGRGGQGGTGLGDGGGWGGRGGAGGTGGPGGDVDVYIDDRFDDLERMVTADVDGGPGGPGGMPGKGGEADRWSGSGVKTSGEATRGAPGPSGADGKRGPAGAARFARADVRERFENLGALVPY